MALMAVLAHGLLSAASNARSIVTTLRVHGASLDADRRAGLLERAEAHLAFVCESLLDLARGLPPEISEALHARPADGLSRPEPQVDPPTAD